MGKCAFLALCKLQIYYTIFAAIFQEGFEKNPLFSLFAKGSGDLERNKSKHLYVFNINMFETTLESLDLDAKKQTDFEIFILKSFGFASFERKILENRG